MTKHLYRLASNLQGSLRQCAGSPPRKNWIKHALRVQLDAWATLYRWHKTNERIIRLTQEQEDAHLDPLPPELDLATAELQHSAVAVQLPDREDWIVVARLLPSDIIVVHGSQTWAYAQPVITYVANSGTGIAAGYIGLHDQPTPALLHLVPGTFARKNGTITPLTEADITEDDYRLAIALSVLYRL